MITGTLMTFLVIQNYRKFQISRCCNSEITVMNVSS